MAYAYSNFKTADGVIAAGDKISQGDIDATDEEWEELIETGAVGDDPIPEDLGTDESLNQYRVRRAQEDMAAAQAGEVIKARKESSGKKADEPASSKS